MVLEADECTVIVRRHIEPDDRATRRKEAGPKQSVLCVESDYLLDESMKPAGRVCPHTVVAL